MNGLTDYYEIWHTVPLYRVHGPLKFRTFKNPRWRTAVIFKIEKLSHLSNGLPDHHKIRPS